MGIDVNDSTIGRDMPRLPPACVTPAGAVESQHATDFSQIIRFGNKPRSRSQSMRCQEHRLSDYLKHDIENAKGGLHREFANVKLKRIALTDPRDAMSSSRDHLLQDLGRLDRSNAGSAEIGFQSSERAYHLKHYTAPAMDFAAAGFSMATVLLSAVPAAARATGVISGVSWMLANVLHEVNNSPRNLVMMAGNVAGVVAGAYDTPTPFLAGQSQVAIGYGSAACWTANGVAYITSAMKDGGRNATTRVLQGASGVANAVAAVAAAESVRASTENDGVRATRLGIASSALWGTGAVLMAGAAWASGRE